MSAAARRSRRDHAYDGLLAAVRKLDLIVARQADARLAAEAGVSRGQFLVLETLTTAQHAQQSQSRLAEHLGLTRAAVSRHVNDAAAAGLLRVSTSPRSGREVEMTLTVEGRRRVELGRAARAAAAAETLDGMRLEDVTSATLLLAKITDRLSRHESDAVRGA